MIRGYVNIVFAFFVVGVLLGCGIQEEEKIENIQPLSIGDLQGQWTLVRVDTLVEKQSIELNEAYNGYGVEQYRPWVELVDGVIKCLDCDGYGLTPTYLEFCEDTLYNYRFPKRLESKHSIDLSDNVLEFKTEYGYGIWFLSAGPIEVSKKQDTLYIAHLEESGLYVKEVYVSDQFDDSLVRILKNYGENLGEAAGSYSLSEYFVSSGEDGSYFEHFHSFPHDIPENLDFSRDTLLEIMKNSYKVQILTDGQFKPYKLSWNSWSENEIWLTAGDWFIGADTSNQVLYEKLKE